jgi:hypothetical protein
VYDSPCLGPALRRATSRYNVDVIFDGEIESWDNAKQELVPFGFNRTIALLRRSYLHRRGLLEAIDSNLHSNAADDSMRVMGAADDLRFSKNKSADENDNATAGKDAWLQYFIFDILYVGGPDAKKLLVECGLDHVQPADRGGDGVSLVQLSALERKQVLYRLVQEQPHEVAICPTVVIRPTGEWVDGAAYFSVTNPMMECGYVVSRLDSTLHTIRGMSLSATTISHGNVESLDEVDRKRRGAKTDAHISGLRSQALDRFYSEVVEQHRYEGLVLKDLASPYIFGRESRKLNYWRKFKPDFEKDAKVVDMDVVILGAYFASGNRHSGQISHFLCGIVDSNDTSTFMTLCNVNGKSVAYDKLDAIVSKTGFLRATQDQELQLGKWFVQDEHGDPLPDFISRRSLQREKEDYDGWKFNKSKNYPDLWIHPEDSVVLTIFGQELAISPEYSAGISLRFARISKIRMEEVDGDEKSPYEIDTDETLWEIFQENIQKRRESTLAAQRGGGDAIMEGSGDNSAPGNEVANYRFLTPEEYGRKPKKRKRRNTPTSPSKVPKVESKASSALRGVTVVVLEGRYVLDPASLDAKEAQQQGWLTEAQTVKQYTDVMRFVLQHDGTISASGETGKNDDNSSNYNTLIVGGSESDARVINYMRSINRAREMNILNPKSKKDKALQKMGQTIGIVKWTFLFSVVTRWLSEKASSPSGVGTNELDDQVEGGFEIFRPAGSARPSILATHPEMLLPQKHQYVALSHIQEKVIDTVFDPSNAQEIALIDLQRGLEEIQERIRAQETANVQTPDLKPWQYVGYQSLEAERRWILSGPSSTLWPYRLGSDLPSESQNAVVLYPDIFDGDDLGHVVEQDAIDEIMSFTERATSGRWQHVIGVSTSPGFRENRMAGCLLLARAMGAVVTPHLHGGVTHILCDLNEEDDSQCMVYDLSVMNERQRPGRARLEHLSSRIKALNAHNIKPICVVSPTWVRSQWAQRIKVDA